jgi:hypothetical protein
VRRNGLAAPDGVPAHGHFALQHTQRGALALADPSQLAQVPPSTERRETPSQRTVRSLERWL